MPDLKASILIVEDEEPIRTSLAEILKVLGHRVRCAADGIAALVEINQEIPEILLSDLNMPGMSGFELLPASSPPIPSRPCDGDEWCILRTPGSRWSDGRCILCEGQRRGSSFEGD